MGKSSFTPYWLLNRLMFFKPRGTKQLQIGQTGHQSTPLYLYIQEYQVCDSSHISLGLKCDSTLWQFVFFPQSLACLVDYNDMPNMHLLFVVFYNHQIYAEVCTAHHMPQLPWYALHHKMQQCKLPLINLFLMKSVFSTLFFTTHQWCAAKLVCKCHLKVYMLCPPHF